MQEYDVALKLLLQSQAGRTIGALTGTVIARWLDVELPKVQNLRLDLLGETAGGDLIQLELQSRNDAGMPLRMAEYCLGVYRLFGRFPRQVLLYVGEAPLRMATELRGGGLSFEYQAVDIRSLDGHLLLDSDEVGDNVIAILAHLRDHKEAVRKIVTGGSEDADLYRYSRKQGPWAGIQEGFAGRPSGRRTGDPAAAKSDSVRYRRGPINAWRALPRSNWRNWRCVSLTPPASKTC
jgi:hypothetical protein